MKTVKTENKKTEAKNKAMKTKNNVQKTILRFAAVVISLVLISITVSAQDFWKRLIAGSSFNEIALAMVDHSKSVKTNTDLTYTAFNSELTQETEESMNLEPWMMDNNYFSGATLKTVNETEDQLTVEPWMINKKLFEGQKAEESLELESWMISDQIWK